MPAGLVWVFTITGIVSFHLTAIFFSLSLSLSRRLHFISQFFTSLSLTLFYKSATFFTHTERERVDSESRCFLLTTIWPITLFAFLWYSLFLSIDFDNGEELDWNAWFSELRFCDPDVWDLVVCSFFFFFWKRARSSSVLVFLLNPFVYLRVF